MNYICICGLLPYLCTFIYNLFFYNISFVLFFPLFVFINGIILHGFYANSFKFICYDTICNIFFSLYTNYYTLNQPYCIINSLFIYCMFIINVIYFNRSSIIHVLCIQLVSLQLYLDSNIL